MTRVIPNPIPASPAAPDRSDRATFSTKATNWAVWVKDNAVPGMNQTAQDTYDNAVDAAGSAAAAWASAGNALASEQAAAVSANAALNAPGTTGTSVSALSVGAGSKSLTIQAGKVIVPGMTLVIARTAMPASVRMSGVVTAYNAVTGLLDVSVDGFTGSGSFSDWTVSLSAAVIGSDLGRRVIQVKVIDDLTALATGDNKLIILVPQELNGYELVDANAYVTNVSSSGVPTIQIRNVGPGADMLSTRITIDVNEFTSYSAATPAVVNPTHAAVAGGDRLAVDVDVAGAGSKGLGVLLTFQLPWL